MTFTTKRLKFKFELGSGDFGSAGFNAVDVPDGLWATARISKNGSPAYNEADISVAGLTLSLQNQLTRIGLQAAAVRNNLVTVQASDGGADTTIFVGGIQNAWTDFASPAEPIFRINANTGLYNALKTANPTSYTGPTDIVDVMKKLAGDMDYTLENNGVSGIKLTSPYLPGSARSQAISAADAAGIYVYFEDDKGIMAITPIDGARGTPVPVLSPPQLVGYPTYLGPGEVALTTIFNPLLRFLGNVTVANSIVKNANATWRVTSLVHDLSTRPGGPWFSQIRANNIAQGQQST